MRIACLLVPDLPLAAELRSHPELRGRPLAVATGPGPRAEILAATPEAVRAGVRPGGSVVHARAGCVELVVHAASPSLERSARETLLDAALSCSPRAVLAPRAPGSFAAEAAVYADAHGVTHLFRSEAGFATALAERCRSLDLPAVVGLASSAEVAHVAARSLCTPSAGAGRVRVLPPGRESAFLAPLPLDLLNPEADLLDGLARLGIRRLGELARLPARALGTRLGPEVLGLRALARGEAPPRPLPPPGPARIEEVADPGFPVAHLEGLLFVLRGLLSRLLDRLEVRHLACGNLELGLDLENGGRDVRRVGVAAPTGDGRVLLRLLRLSLEAHSPRAAVLSVSLATRGAAPRRDQLDLWRPAGPAPTTLDALVAELQTLCGPGGVGAPALRADWSPDPLRLTRFEPHRLPHPPSPLRSAPATWALRILRPPVPAEVRSRRGRPEWLRSAAARGRVLHCAGPWRTTGGWWSEQERFALDHYDVQTEDGTVCRLRHDRLRGGWQVDAIYD